MVGINIYVPIYPTKAVHSLCVSDLPFDCTADLGLSTFTTNPARPIRTIGRAHPSKPYPVTWTWERLPL